MAASHQYQFKNAASDIALSAAVGGGIAVGTAAFAGFSAPAALFGMAALPVLAWLMRVKVLQYLDMDFPPIRFLFKAAAENQAPQSLPLWHKAIRLGAAGAMITGLAQPVLPQQGVAFDGSDPVTFLIDNGWASGRTWERQQAAIHVLIERAGHGGRRIILRPTAQQEDGTMTETAPLGAQEAHDFVSRLTPKPWPVNRLRAISEMNGSEKERVGPVLWVSDGISDNDDDAEIITHLNETGSLTIIHNPPSQHARLLRNHEGGINGMPAVEVHLSEYFGKESVRIAAVDDSNTVIMQAEARFAEGEKVATAVFDLGEKDREKLARFDLVSEKSAGGILLSDERWRARPVGVITQDRFDTAQTLLSDTIFIQKALESNGGIQSGDMDLVLGANPAVIIMTDSAVLGGQEKDRLMKWIEEGGTLLRFAGANLVNNPDDPFVPFPLKQDVQEGDASREVAIETNLPDSPLSGIRQDGGIVIQKFATLKENFEAENHVWARTADGIPVVTGVQKDKGKIVLVHTTANTDWSNLVLSDFFIDVMRTIISQSRGVIKSDQHEMSPIQVIDGKGNLVSPGTHVRSLNAEIFNKGLIGPNHPPGIYGTDYAQKAFNLADGVRAFKAMPEVQNARYRTYAQILDKKDVSDALLAGALALLIADLAAGMFLNPSQSRKRKPAPSPMS